MRQRSTGPGSKVPIAKNLFLVGFTSRSGTCCFHRNPPIEIHGAPGTKKGKGRRRHNFENN